LKNIDAEEARKLLSVQPGAPLDLSAFNEGLEELKARYRNKGYLDMRITNEDSDSLVRYSNKNRIAVVTLDIDEGVQYRVTSISIEGLTKTRAFIAERELQFKVGDVLEEGKVIESERRLRRLGLFGSVKIQHRINAKDPTTRDVRVLLSEGTPGLVAGGL